MRKLISVFLALCFVGAASASTIPVKFSGVDGLSSGFDGTYKDQSFSSIGAGIYQLETGASSPSPGSYQFEQRGPVYNTPKLVSFCIDLRQRASGTFLTYNILDPEDAPVTGNPTDVMGPNKADALGRFWFQFGNLVTNATEKSAFQLAIWEIVWENWDGVNKGIDNATLNVDAANGSGATAGFAVTVGNTTARNQANAWLASFNNSGTDMAGLTALSYYADQDLAQDYLIQTNGDGTQVPGPSVLVALLSMGLLGFLKSRRRRN